MFLRYREDGPNIYMERQRKLEWIKQLWKLKIKLAESQYTISKCIT